MPFERLLAQELSVRGGEGPSFQQDVVDQVGKDPRRGFGDKLRNVSARRMTRRRCRALLGRLRVGLVDVVTS